MNECGANLLIANTTAPNTEPTHNVYWADFAEAFFQNMPNRKTVVIGGARCAITSLIPLNKLSYWFINGNKEMDNNNAMPAEILPTETNFLSLAAGRLRLYKS